MRLNIYIDGFNLYYSLLKKRPHLKWVNPKLLAEQVLKPTNRKINVRYYTADVSGRIDPTAPSRQKTYLNAIATVPEITVHKGSFLTKKSFARMVHPPNFYPKLDDQLPKPWPDTVEIYKPEEKGSDVNLACHLLRDAFQGNFDVAAVLSNDSDLAESIRIATQEFGRIVGILTPVPVPNKQLCKEARFTRQVKLKHLIKTQFPDTIKDSKGKQIIKPTEWN